jgi:excisionase family DNA binding protein
MREWVSRRVLGYMTITERIEQFDTLLTPETLAKLLSVSVKTIYKWNSHGLPYFRLRSAIRHEPSAVARWLRDREIKPKK